MANFENEAKSVKKSFELKYEIDDEDDDAEVFIVHEEDDNEEGQMMEFDQKEQHEQDELFVQQPSVAIKAVKAAEGQPSEEGKKSSPKSPTEGFEKIEINADDIENIKKGDEPDALIENPFKDNLANSESLPAIQKLDVVINDNYLSPDGAEVNQKKQVQLLSQSVAAPASSGGDLQDLGLAAGADGEKPSAQTSSIH